MVKRYYLRHVEDDACMEDDACGDYVLYSDYTALREAVEWDMECDDVWEWVLYGGFIEDNEDRIDEARVLTTCARAEVDKFIRQANPAA